MSLFTMPISEQIWDMKYRMKTAAGEPIDLTVRDTWHRIAKKLGSSWHRQRSERCPRTPQNPTGLIC